MKYCNLQNNALFAKEARLIFNETPSPASSSESKEKKEKGGFFSKIKKGIRNGVKGLFGVSIMAPNIAVGSVATIPDTAKETYKGLKDRWSKVAESDKWYKKGAKALSTLTLGTGIEAVYGLGRYVRNNIKFLFNTNPAGSAIKEYWGVKKEEKSNGDSEKK